MASYLSRDFTGTSTNADKFTLSFWWRISIIDEVDMLMSNTETAGNYSFEITHLADNRLKIIQWDNGVTAQYITTRLFRDCTSWYHIVISADSTQATAANRLKLYVNGVEVVKFDTETDIAQNTDYTWNVERPSTSNGWRIGNNYNATQPFRGYLAHIHNVDGLALAATVFGETDSTTGEWKPILTPSVTYGTNGWFLKFENSGALGTDSSGNSATFTVSGDLKQSISTPSNLFCTLNPLETYNTNVNTAIKYGATGFEDANYGSDGPKGSVGILATTGGKWYFEVKHVEGMYSTAGISKANTLAVSKMLNTTYRSPFIQGNEGDGFGFQMDTATLIQRGDNTEAQWYQSDGSTNIANFADGDICMIAYDLDAGKIWWGKNGTWLDAPGTSNTGNPATGANAHKTWTANGAFFRPAVSCYQRSYGGGAGANPNSVQCNFGEGRFGTTAVSSAVADGDGNGAFEYAPPSGFYAVCTKALKSRS